MLTLSHTEGLELTDLVVSDTQGRGVGTTLDVDSPRVLPETFSLGQNYPNPFNGTTTMEYSIPVTTDLTLTVYNLLGQSVSTLTSGYKDAGTYSLIWDASDAASGMYFVKAQADGFTKIQKLMLVK